MGRLDPASITEAGRLPVGGVLGGALRLLLWDTQASRLQGGSALDLLPSWPEASERVRDCPPSYKQAGKEQRGHVCALSLHGSFMKSLL